MVISTPVMPGTARAASVPPTPSRVPSRGMGIMRMPQAEARVGTADGRPRALRSTTSSRLEPSSITMAFEQRPPIVLAATSSTATGEAPTRSSA